MSASNTTAPAFFRVALLFLVAAAGLSCGRAENNRPSTTTRGLVLTRRRHGPRDGPEAETPKSPARLPNVKDNGVLMSAAEQALVMDSLGSEKTMLEYGTGGSTKYYSRFVRHYYTIEHNQRFFEMMKPDLDALPNVVAHLEPVEKGYNGWTGGMNAGNYEQFHNYVHAIDKLGVKHFDVVLVDGRARVACTVNALKYLHEDSVVLIHDFRGRSRGRRYNQVLHFYDKIDLADTIIRLRPKPEMLRVAHYVNLQQLYALAEWTNKPEPTVSRQYYLAGLTVDDLTSHLGRRFSRQYIQVLLFYDEVERADSIVKLKPKPEMLQIARYVDIAHLYAWQVKGSPHGIDLKKWNEL
eukprot:CAMPEP_0117661920 /NCGR_PEP_ID=MMETSP0804-20121206/7789_1 /TAXON_ID=1074897 /ORGANISM="Tetraselmis astigmatica, Strain CCMP880" /LENGTH=352 /DNA_ID=CAMNT_0005468809 /DNA_START=73 /DNA_END=1130 /DNA_ORIENTATION=-